jgi:hypothetical protein
MKNRPAFMSVATTNCAIRSFIAVFLFLFKSAMPALYFVSLR